MKLITLILLSILGIQSQSIENETRDKIDEFINTTMGCYDIVAMGLAIVKDGKTKYTKGYGVKDVQTQVWCYILTNQINSLYCNKFWLFNNVH